VRLIDLETEVRGQLQKVSAAGIRLTHVDGHKHVHVVPKVFRLICRIAPDYGIRAVRSTIEGTPGLHSLLARNVGAAGQILKQYVFGKTLSGTFVLARFGNGSGKLNAPERFYGITQTGFLDLPAFADVVRGLPNGISELMCHPGYVDEELRRTPTRLHVQRERELELLTGREVRDVLDDAAVELTSYRDLGDCPTNG
jgi:chitin disaccharide deacetylase